MLRRVIKPRMLRDLVSIVDPLPFDRQALAEVRHTAYVCVIVCDYVCILYAYVMRIRSVYVCAGAFHSAVPMSPCIVTGAHNGTQQHARSFTHMPYTPV